MSVVCGGHGCGAAETQPWSPRLLLGDALPVFGGAGCRGPRMAVKGVKERRARFSWAVEFKRLRESEFKKRGPLLPAQDSVLWWWWCVCERVNVNKKPVSIYHCKYP